MRSNEKKENEMTDFVAEIYRSAGKWQEEHPKETAAIKAKARDDSDLAGWSRRMAESLDADDARDASPDLDRIYWDMTRNPHSDY